jgi:glycosyltransferase involved in cell wall biosynthesis
MRVALLADFLGYSGGDFVNIVIIKCLMQLGCDVDVYTLDSFRLLAAYGAFDITPPDKLNIRSFKVPIPSPYALSLLCLLLAKDDYDLLVLNDDVPKTAFKKGRRFLVYVHYPHLARIAGVNMIDWKYRATTSGYLQWTIHKHLFPWVFLDSDRPGITFLANSSMSMSVLRNLFPQTEKELLFPPVQSRKIAMAARSKKEDEVIVAGRLMPGRGIEDLFYAVRTLRREGISLETHVAGPCVDERYKVHLKNLVKSLRLDKVTHFEGFVDRKRLVDLFLRSKLYIHTNPREPFGITVVESMAAGCIPLVRRSGGPWNDILGKREEHGFGYSTYKELGAKMKLALESEVGSHKARARSLDFDEEVFVRDFKAAFEHALNNPDSADLRTL